MSESTILLIEKIGEKQGC